MSDDAGEDREAILRRRRRFIATALAGASITIATSCAQPCLRYAPDAGPADAGTDGGDDEADAGGE